MMPKFKLYGLHKMSGNWMALGSTEVDDLQDAVNVIAEPLQSKKGYIQVGSTICYPEDFAAFEWNPN